MSLTETNAFTETDRFFMRRALDLAHEGRFTVSPNPRVGCVIVHPATPSTPTNAILGEGYHLQKGKPHAERVALSQCKTDPRGATLYVTLEPCCHQGATPPCTEAILQAGIARVVTAIRDPFTEVQGRGIEQLRSQGVQVDVGLFEEEAWYENRFFFQYHTQNRPWVLAKAAITLDGKMATHTGHSQWITGEKARAHAHDIRAQVDAILVGMGTVITDDPLLTPRLPELPKEKRYPLRIVLDPQLRISIQSQLIQTIDQAPVWVFCQESVPDSALKELTSMDVKVTRVKGEKHSLDLKAVLESLAKAGIQSVLIEGGPKVHTSFLSQGLVNELWVYIAPKLAGGKEAPTFYMGTGEECMNHAHTLERVQYQTLGNDFLVQGILHR